MQHTKKHIDCFVNVIDNFGDMGYILEFCLYYKKNYPKNYHFYIFTNDQKSLMQIFALNNCVENVSIYDVKDWRKMSDLAISFLHADFPKKAYKKVFRVDYLSFDESWLAHNGDEHFLSSEDFRIFEMIISPQNRGS